MGNNATQVFGSGARMTHVVAPGHLDFALHTLGWRNFQDLTAIVLREVFGQTFKIFADSNDGGRDGAFYGTWTTKAKDALGITDGDIPQGPTVVQCKFISRAGVTLTPSMIQEEMSKIKRLVGQGLCQNYLLVTNATLTGVSEGKIIAAIKELGVKHVNILDGRWICQTITSNQNLRLYVPRVYGLGDLSKILDERAYAQARVLLDYLKDDLATFVITDAYAKAADALKNNSFVFLVGEPASGKSVIAASLAVAAIDNWKCLAVKVNGPKEMLEHWDPNEQGQFFWIDDAFGATYYDRSLTDQWVHALPEIGAAIKKGARIVITSRDYIYREAKAVLKEYSYPFLREQQVVVKVADLSRDEKERILYNHIRLGDQSTKFKKTLKPHLERVAEVERFLPEVARRLGSKMFSQNLDPADEAQVVRFMEHPSEFLQDILQGMPPEHLTALYLVYQSGRLESPVKILGAHQNIVSRLGQHEADVVRGLAALEGTFLRLTSSEDGGKYSRHWEFKHPTLREGLSYFLSKQPELLEILIRGMTFDELFTQLTCGTKGRGLLEVPLSIYDLIVDRLIEYRLRLTNDPKLAENRILELRQYQFLQRGSKEFLDRCVDRVPNLIPDLLGFWGHLAWDPRVMVLAALAKSNLLDEKDRRIAAERLKQIALDNPDATWMDDASCEEILTEQEKDNLIQETREMLLADFDPVLNSWALNEEDDLDSYYEPLLETMDSYADFFENDEPVLVRIRQHREAIEERTYKDQDINEDAPKWKAPELNKASEMGSSRRSIFEDVDG